MESNLRVRVRYPLSSGRIVLRASHDWERDIEPVERDGSGTCFDFQVDLGEDPFCYFKPVLLEGRRERWSQGGNYLGLPQRSLPAEVFPHFFDEPTCSVCRLERRPSRTGARAHRFRIFTPPGYEENTLARYPVLYMHDGQNLFFPEEAFAGQPWKVDETIRLLDAMNLVRKMIVVGIWPENRMEDYTLPGYGEFGRYLVEEVKPWVDRNYRTLPGPGETAVLGASLGGVVSLHLAWEYPHVFGHAGCMSSTFGYADDLAARIEREERRPVRLYLDSGWPGDNYEVTLAMRDLLRSRGYTDGRDLMHIAFPKAEHDERAWSSRLHQPLQFFFGER